MSTPESSYREIPLTQGRVAIVDAHRFPELSNFKWHLQVNKTSGAIYAARTAVIPGIGKRLIFMHRHILGLGYGDRRQGDHIDHTQTLKNTDDNLRIAVNTQQCWNRGDQKDSAVPYKGVCRRKGRGKPYRARIMAHGKRKCLGSFDTAEDAYAAYCAAAIELHGEFACLN